MEANRAGVDEAVLLNAQGRVAEGSADNLFVVRGGALLTPPSTEGALEGVTRNVVIELAQQADITMCETPLAPYDLDTAFCHGNRIISGRHSSESSAVKSASNGNAK